MTKTSRRTFISSAGAFVALKARGAANDFYDIIDMAGYPLVVFPQWLDVPRAEKMLKDVCENPKYAIKPVFDQTNPQKFYYLLVREGGKGRIRFNKVKIERQAS